MTTYYARVEYEYTGGDRTFSIPFSYINKEHIIVRVNEEETTNFVFNSESQIQINDTLIAGDKITIVRNTPINERLVIFTNTSILNKENQNLSAQQTFDVVQEIYDNNTNRTVEQDDKINTALATSNIALSNSQTAISTSNIALSTSNTALSNSQTAISTANNASSVAVQAAQDAQSAVTVANNAETIAETTSDKVDEFEQDIEEVKEAATKINQLEQAVQTAVTAAGTATTQAQTATSKASEATNAAQVATIQAEEAKAKVGDLTTLTTVVKSTVVAAINELNSNKQNTATYDSTNERLVL